MRTFGSTLNRVDEELDGMIADHKAFTEKYGKTQRQQRSHWRLNKIQQLVEFNRAMFKELTERIEKIKEMFPDGEIYDEMVKGQHEAVKELVESTSKWVQEYSHDDNDEVKP
jgi:uncharacterized protein (UPF0305 family)